MISRDGVDFTGGRVEGAGDAVDFAVDFGVTCGITGIVLDNCDVVVVGGVATVLVSGYTRRAVEARTYPCVLLALQWMEDVSFKDTPNKDRSAPSSLTSQEKDLVVSVIGLSLINH